jgi:hypothetical protein
MNELPEEKKKALKDMYIVKSIIKKPKRTQNDCIQSTNKYINTIKSNP